MAKQDVTYELYYDTGSGAAWHEHNLFRRTVLGTTRGAGEEGQAAPPSTLSGSTVDNRGGALSPTNPASALYGAVGRNTPARVTVGTSARLTVETRDWELGRNERGNVAWASMGGAGLLSRIGSYQTALRSSPYRAIMASSPIAYWPLEDGKDSDLALNAVAGGASMTESGVVDFAAVPGPAGSTAVAPVFLRQDAWAGGLDVASGIPQTGTGWTVDAWIRVTATADDAFVPLMTWRSTGLYGGDGWIMSAERIAGTTAIEVGADHNPLSSTSYREIGVNPMDGAWHHVRFTLSQDSSTQVSGNLYYDGALVDGDITTNITRNTVGHVAQITVGDYGGVLSSVDTFFLPTNVDGVSVAHVAVWDSPAPSLSAADAYDAGRGWVGEPAGVRFLRVCAEEGLSAAVVGTDTDTQLMGPQPSAVLMEILSEIATTDAGLLFEPRDSIGLVYRTGRDVANQSSVLTVDYTALHVAIPLSPLLGNKYFSNDVTVERRNGGSASATLDTGPLSTADPPTGAGRKPTKVPVNPDSDARLPGYAGWWLYRGTIAETRWPTVTVNVTSQAAPFVAEVDAVDIGDRIVIANLPSDWAQDPVHVIVIGIRESIGTHQRRVTFVTMPAQAFEVGVIGADDGSIDMRGQLIDSDLWALASGVSSSATSLSVKTLTGGALWDTASDNWSTAQDGSTVDGRTGAYITIGGEIMKVTNITGASSPQTFTVVRHVNGVTKAHSADAPVHAAYPFTIGL